MEVRDRTPVLLAEDQVHHPRFDSTHVVGLERRRFSASPNRSWHAALPENGDARYGRPAREWKRVPCLTRSGPTSSESLRKLIAPRRRHPGEALRERLRPEAHGSGRHFPRALAVTSGYPGALLHTQLSHRRRVRRAA